MISKLFLMCYLSQQYNSVNNLVLSTIWLLNLLNVVYFPLLNRSCQLQVGFRGEKKDTLLQWHPFYIHLSNISLITAMLPLYLMNKNMSSATFCSLEWNALCERHSIDWNIKERASEDFALHFHWKMKPLLVFKSCLLPSFPHSPPSDKMVAEQY